MLSKKLLWLFQNNKYTLACLESVTGGSLANVLTNEKGSSEYFIGSLVVYWNKVKIDVGQIDQNLIAKHTVYSIECAEAMATQACQIFGSNLGIGVTGHLPPFNDKFIKKSGGKAKTIVYMSLYNKKTDKHHNHTIILSNKVIFRRAAKLLVVRKILDYMLRHL